MEAAADISPKRGTVRILNRILHMIARVAPGSTNLRPSLHRLRGVKIGNGVFIGDDVYLENEYPECVEIGDNVEVGLRSIIIAHLRGPGRIVIERNAWIGAGCIVATAAGRVLTIGEGAVVGAGSVITSDVSAHAFVRPAPPQQVGTAQVPLSTSTYMEFVRGLRPARRARKSSDQAPVPKTGT